MLRQFYNNWISPQRWLDRAGVRAPMQIVIGLTLLLCCVLSFARTMHFIPTDEEASLHMRMIVSEMAASRVASLITTADYAPARDFLNAMVHNSDDVLSAGLRQMGGSVLIQTEGHEKYWQGPPPDVNTPTHIQVLLYENLKPWGYLEICFRPLHSPTTWLQWVSQASAGLMIFIAAGSFLLFWIFLSRMLRVLDPSAAVPGRMQLLMDTLVEGMVILDEQERIVMTNQSFARTAFLSVDRLLGRTLSSLPWLAADGESTLPVSPWQAVQETDLPQRGVSVRLQIGTRHSRRLNVNASPILDPSGARRGVLVTFDDQTIVESDNLQLAKLVARFKEAGDDIHHLREQLLPDAEPGCVAKLEQLVEAAGEMARICGAATNSLPAESEIAAAEQTEKPPQYDLESRSSNESTGANV